MELVELGNRHPADRLADLRARIAELEQEVEELKRYFIDNPRDRIGSEYKVSVANKTSGSKYLDQKALRQHFGNAQLEPFYRRSAPYTIVNVWKLK